jgi:hypothetical protein
MSALFVAVLLAPADAGASHRKLRGTVVASSGEVVVKKTESGTTRACFRASGQKTVLAVEEPRNGPEYTRAFDVIAAGRFVGYRWISDAGSAGAAIRARVVDARRRRVVTNVDAYTDSRLVQPALGSFSSPTLAPEGTFAWFAQADRLIGLPSELRLARPSSRKSVVVATGDGFEDDSIALGRRYVYWRHDGIARSAELAAL